MAKTGPSDELKALFDESVRILREDAQLAHNRALMERLDKIERQTVKHPQTPEEKAAAWDEYVSQRGTGNPPPTPPAPTHGQPTPPPTKPAPEPPNKNGGWWEDYE